MKKKYWFRPKKYGYGITPSSWEGWLTTFIFTGILMILAYLNGLFAEPETTMNILLFLIETLATTFLFINWCKHKTDGELKWRWGNK